MELLTCFSEEEKKELDYLNREKLIVYSAFSKPCFLLNDNGEFTYEQCFGTTESMYWRSQHFEKLTPRRIFRYYDFYFLEDVDEQGSWFVGFLQKNGAVQFLSGHSNLCDAIDSI